jgi:hypothetical protein
VFTPAEIKALIDRLGLRERTLVLLAASTGLRQSIFLFVPKLHQNAAAPELPIVLKFFPTFGRGFDSHRPLHNS